MAAPAAAGSGAGALRVTLLSPEQTVFQGTADAVVVPAFNGKMGILRGHAPTMALLGEGELRITTGGTEQRFRVAGGFMQIADNEVTILSERAEAA